MKIIICFFWANFVQNISLSLKYLARVMVQLPIIFSRPSYTFPVPMTHEAFPNTTLDPHQPLLRASRYSPCFAQNLKVFLLHSWPQASLPALQAGRAIWCWVQPHTASLAGCRQGQAPQAGHREVSLHHGEQGDSKGIRE